MVNETLRQQLNSMSLDQTSRHKIIIGIDYGTTFSGISYVTTDKSDIHDINIISDWPGEQHTTWKTPTRLAYQKENPSLTENKWGFEVRPKLISYSWTKLLLDKNALAGDYDDPALLNMTGQGMMRLPRFRTAPEVCEDFLRGVYEYVSSKLRRQMTDIVYDNTPMECWVTLPAIWSEEAKVATLEAAKKAGFSNRPGDEIFTIAEPEAAAIATLKMYSHTDSFNKIKPRDNILICDCGGGTVDITTYTIVAVEPRLEFDELYVGVGGKCGSTYIDRNLHAFLSERFGSAFDEVPDAQKGPGSAFMRCFEGVKRDFGRNEERDLVELSPLRLDTEDSFCYDEEERMVILTHEEMQGLFDPVVDQIINLVEQQVNEAKENQNAVIDRIVLVGGFGESPYLNKVLKEWCLQHGEITLMCPEHPQSAVVRGAALRGLEGVTPRIKKARRHYGIGLNCRFKEGVDPESLGFIDEWDGSKLCMNRIAWLVSKGENVSADTVLTQSYLCLYNPGETTRCTTTLYSTALDIPPRYSTDSRVEEVGIVTSRFPKNFDFGPSAQSVYNTKLKKMIHQFKAEIQVRFGDKGSNLTFKDLVNGEVKSSASIEFSSH
ncbi:Hsp70 family protein-like protein [Leptodontidium sp. 2 PMI_412]|nr:Hsp70 family protein-like protein [Leptodontidium sp. 2 PMI_412]